MFSDFGNNFILTLTFFMNIYPCLKIKLILRMNVSNRTFFTDNSGTRLQRPNLDYRTNVSSRDQFDTLPRTTPIRSTIASPKVEKGEFKLDKPKQGYVQFEDEDQEPPKKTPQEKPRPPALGSPNIDNESHILGYTPKKQRKGHRHHHYDPLAIPADWKIARKHAAARRVAIEKRTFDENDEVCPCCGYEVERRELNLCDDVKKLNFLGSGLPLFYNYVVFCIFILFVQLSVKGGFDIYVNITGTYCLLPPDPTTPANLQCPQDWMSTLSLANSYNEPDLIPVKANLDILMVFTVMIILALFRVSQKQMEVDIDKSYISAGDYTILVRNIPIGLKVHYKDELKKMFETSAVKDERIEVTKIILVHQISEIVTLEKQLDGLVAQKQEYLFNKNMNFRDPKIADFNKRIHEHQKDIHQKEKDLELDDSKFEGIALISFQTEDMKRAVMDANPYTFWDQVKCYQSDGNFADANTLSWNGRKLFISEAPEPNGIDWNNIHAKTKDRIMGTIKSFLYSAAFMLFIFLLLWGISIWKTTIMNQIKGEIAAGIVSAENQVKAAIMTSIVSWVIVLFNKFIIGPVFKQFVLMERIDTKTEFNISMAKKVTIALFINTCILVYIIEIVINDNIIGDGGFIQGETAVFVSNAWFTILVWLVDPWSIDKASQRNKVLHNPDPQPTTQQEANLLMENTDYSQSKRYCDVMKTMWFTFFYGDAIPIGIVINIVCLFLYYWVDKYNVLRRRTIKDTISSDLSNEMISWLGFILVLHGIGQMSMTYGVYKFIPWQQYFVLVISVIYMLLPIAEWTRRLLPIEELDESADYDIAQVHFETDYDRENPITRTFALKKWQMMHDELMLSNEHKQVHDLEKHAGYKFQFPQ